MKNSKIGNQSVEYSPSLHIDFDDPKQIKDLAVGVKVKIVVEGVVRGMEQREDWEDPKKMRSSLSLKDVEATVVPYETDFDELMDD